MLEVDSDCTSRRRSCNEASGSKPGSCVGDDDDFNEDVDDDDSDEYDSEV